MPTCATNRQSPCRGAGTSASTAGEPPLAPAGSVSGSLTTAVLLAGVVSSPSSFRHCHTTAKMDPDKQSDKAMRRHEKGRAAGLTCIECHFAITHKEPDGPGPQELFSKEPLKQVAR